MKRIGTLASKNERTYIYIHVDKFHLNKTLSLLSHKKRSKNRMREMRKTNKFDTVQYLRKIFIRTEISSIQNMCHSLYIQTNKQTNKSMRSQFEVVYILKVCMG
jgi:hypothetical protein